nr:T9SS type A sorting domain-containing protein [candidate division Zixibacteria bacterium]
MKIYYTLSILIALAISAVAMADPGVRDTVRVGSLSALPGDQFTVPVYFSNDELLNAAEVVLKFESSKMDLDSFSLVGGRLEYVDENTVFSYIAGDTIDINVMDWSTYIPEGNGLFCNLFFTAHAAAIPGQTAIDTVSRSVARTCFADISAMPIYPEFVKGLIDINEPPPSSDSIWVDKVTGSPGQTVAVNINAYNTEDIANMKLALIYGSNDLIYNSTIFTGTRGEAAISKIVSPSSQSLRHLLVTLIFDDDAPLAPGTGVMATILFDIEASAPDGQVAIDSISYLGAQPLEITLTEDYGGLTFTPRFTAGYVEINSATAVEDNDNILIPEHYALEQNVPNPFNPSTVISFDLPTASDIRLEVFNIIGQKVKTLVNGPMPAGHHKITFEGRGDNEQVLSSGVYFYRISAGEFHQSKKMTLIK